MRNRFIPAVVLVILTAGSALQTGCEMNSTEDRIEIAPGSITLGEGQSQTFKVSGGYAYAWSLDPDDGSASLSVRQGDTVVFTLLSSASSSISNRSTIAVICTSTIPGVTGSSTNAAGGDAYSETDTAYVHVQPSG